MKKIIFILLIVFVSCNSEKPTQFSEEANLEMLVGLDNSKITLREVLEAHKGKKILIDVWASWCKDCIVGVPKAKELQKEFPEVVYLFLSVDRSNPSWKRAIKKYNLVGEHYNLPEGMNDGDFVNFINLNWIPRYMVIDETGKIILFKATNASDEKIKEALKINT
ncbi:Thioredoxin-like [Polaribacter sp. KT25b]|jgi:thiol-disulfide isomerase/thioredoxin|uniref:TlpA family protein disulfide reductase n=1 Tax=Polaribacter sp. KT25b TaxID=1855336 RepID=UPI00087DA351|nr:TlpA disulfide reductase family protein [Polaribacter sp. KT25b]SDS29179.1 Thioredoxin-like [Polaribacter sp. KT25b]